jgi:hypothetical protein
VLGKVWALALPHLTDRLCRLFKACLRWGCFPGPWRRTKLVLLRKPGKPEGTPSAYRPICLLDEVGKLFERVIAARLSRLLSREGAGLHEDQYGFRAGRSTIDAIKRVKALTDSIVEEGGVALVVSFDIANAFNSLPWDRIGESISMFDFPLYIREILRSYFRDRALEYYNKLGCSGGRGVECVTGHVVWPALLGPLCKVVHGRHSVFI